MENKIYVVQGSFSSWEDYNVRIFKAFYKKEDAEKYVEKAERVLKAMSQHVAKAWGKISLYQINSMLKGTDITPTGEFKLASDIWHAHQNFEEFNGCFIEEVEIL